MKVLLLEDVENLGFRGEIVQVKDGYARNYLIPRGLAKAVTPSVLKAWEEERRQKRRKLERERKAAETLARKVDGTVLTFTLRVGPEGKAFGSVTSADIVEALAAQGIEGLSRGMVRLRTPLRDMGRHEVILRLYPEVSATVVVEIRPEKSPEQEDTGEAGPEAGEAATEPQTGEEGGTAPADAGEEE